MVGYVANPVCFEVLKEVRDQLVDIEIDEVFFITVLQCLRSMKFPLNNKISFFELVVEKFKKDIEYIDVKLSHMNSNIPKVSGKLSLRESKKQ